ncbi:unnamed protein product [Rotaria magnacalcarata]|uniref:F-box domain-containing protein n=2 Tax=Rotaria magnacalcarata TaxID=392030 RepID=A0A816PMQ4_9BILA|nr:unnamed protein product [Rotaria magnacalcarata]
MGCKHCKIWLTKHENQNNHLTTINTNQNSSSISNHEQPVSLSNQPNSQKTHRQEKCTSLDNLPVELVYHLLDRLDTDTIFTSLYNVCPRLNSIIHQYDKLELKLISISMSHFHHICSLIRPEQIRSLTLSDGNDNVGLVRIFLKKFRMESFKRLHSLTLVNINHNEYMIKIFLSMTDQLRKLSILNSNEIYNDTCIDILMASCGKKSLEKISLHIEKNRFLNPTIIWPDKCFLKEIKLAGICSLALFRNILLHSPNLKKFQANDIDIDDEWIDVDENEEIEEIKILPLVNGSNIISLSLTCARNEMEKLEWLLPQFTQLSYFKYLNIYDYHMESIYESDYSLIEGERWEKIISNCNQFEFIFTIHIDDESWNVHQCVSSFKRKLWQDKNWNIAFEQYDKILLIYSLPYAHDAHYYDRSILFSIPNNAILSIKFFENVTKLRINMATLNDLGKKIIGPPRFSNVSQLILDGQWRNPDTIDSIGSLVCLSNINKLIRLERVPTTIFRTFIYSLINLESLTLTTYVLDSMNAAILQYFKCLHSLNIVQFDNDYRHFVNVEPFCTMFPQIRHLDIPIDNLDSCQYLIERLEKFLISVVFRFPHNDDNDDDDDDDDDDENAELIEWAQSLQQNHQYRLRDGDIYLWFQ